MSVVCVLHIKTVRICMDKETRKKTSNGFSTKINKYSCIINEPLCMYFWVKRVFFRTCWASSMSVHCKKLLNIVIKNNGCLNMNAIWIKSVWYLRSNVACMGFYLDGLDSMSCSTVLSCRRAQCVEDKSYYEN